MERTLHGSCSCGRNQYIVQVPLVSDQRASVLFDSSLRTRRHHGSPFGAFLRVPLSWYHSAASPLFPDEEPSLIRRTFFEPPTPATRPSGLRRQFCGFCGTPLTTWHERTPQDADFISLTLGSLRDQDVRDLEEMGLFQDESDDTGTVSVPASRAATPPELFGPIQVTPGRGAPWFERMVENSRLGRIQRMRGAYASDDGTYREEWEVVEYENGDEVETLPAGKRKVPSS
ncbi:hypothetical protein B0J12DRAFT_559940 [Macrophomina phaseolina]|uniref:Mss4-like protein n=1 Tax=Macrophomina phaseolina TaxID=35725 RepID=A0ABQ8GWE2_9PEZI|nr:hypothetical protein B0J12DRAFT_559940 [Macrophomina phaseolina]